jgi:signal transduction histidine kinase
VAGTLLRDTETTSVYRLGDSAGTIWKKYRGHRAMVRLQRERSILARMAGTVGIGQLAPGPCPPSVLAIEDCGHDSLAEILRDGPLATRTLLSMAEKLASALANVHRAGVIHRDINPSNIMVVRGAPVLIDFDMALVVEDAPLSEEPMAGTLAYMAPEQAGRFRHRPDPRTDLYSLGATLYEMATGRPPFESEDVLELLHAHSATEPLAPVLVNASLPLPVSEIIRKLLAKNPDDRYQSAEGLAHDARCVMAAMDAGLEGPVALGTRDFAPLFAAPAELVGRDDAVHRLRGAFADAREGKVRVALVEGEAGVGKTALIHELKPMVSAAGGRFVAGKFDQLQRAAAPEGGLPQALSAVAQLLLAEPEENLRRHREIIAGKIGLNAALLVDAVPEFAHVLGAQPRPPGLDPTEAAARLLDAAAEVLAALSSPQSPLVVFLDDLQWAGGLSLQLIDRVLQETSVAGLLVVGAFRDGETSEPLASALRRWDESPTAPRRVPLHNLPSAAVIELLGRMMRMPASRAEELAATLQVLTAGNPFDTLETLNALRKEGVLRLGADAWEWNSGAVLCFGSGDVVELLAKRIASLPESARVLLGCMARLGNRVPTALLQAATGFAEAAMEQAMRPSLADGLVLEERGEHPSLRFRHDRVQQAALLALEAHAGADLNLSMARRLAAHPGFQAPAAQQYFACAGHVHDAGEKRSVALLFRAVSERLRDAAEFEQCEQYLARASQLLTESSEAHLRFGIDAARHLALYSLGRFDELDALYRDLRDRAPNPLDLVDASCLQLRSLDARGRMEESLALGVRVLLQLGLTLPPGFRDPRSDEGLDTFRAWLEQERARGNARVSSPPHVLGTAKLLSRMVRSSYMKRDWDALACLTLQARTLWTEHGPCGDLVLAMVRSSNLIISQRKDFRLAYDVQRYILEVAEALQCEPQVFECRHVFSCYARPRFDPIESCRQTIRHAADDLRTRGDMSLSCYLECSAVELEFEYSTSLDSAEAAAHAAMNVCLRTRNESAASILLPEIQVMRALRGLTRPGTISDEGFDEEKYLREENSRHPLSRCVFCVRRAFATAIAGDSELAAVHARQAMDRIDAIAGHFLTVQAHLLHGMGLAGCVRRQGRARDDGGRARLMAQLDAEVAWLSDCARDNPGDLLHFLRFLEAERAWASGDRWRAVVLFDEAVAESQIRRGMWQRALIQERAGGFHLRHGMQARGRELLRAARDIYRAWGAAGKVQALHDSNAWLEAPAAAEPVAHLRAGTSVPALTPDTVDLLGILGASQAMSSETSLDRLCVRVVDTLAAMTGATKVSLLSHHDGNWWLLTPAAHRPCVPLAEAASARLLPMSAVSYAQRTGESFVVDNVVADERFSRDVYFAAQPHTSLLVVAIGKKDALRAMLVLENSLAHSVFTASRLDAVKLVAGQLAVSLANAQLYDQLEQRVHERTQDLQQAQAQLVATARKAGMAEVANSVLHNVGNVLNSINISAAYARRTVQSSKSANLAGAARLLEEHGHDLAEFLVRDPKGKVLPGYLGKLSDALSQEREALLEHLDRLCRSVDHVNAVIATQQSHAGGSSVCEPVQVENLIDEALSLSSPAGSDRGTVVRQFTPLPPMQLDRSRVLQILVNLVTNAWQAMDNLPGASRKLTLASAMSNQEGKEVLRITVRDEGEGIAPANLAKVFAQGFTTKPGGHGFGLHGSAVAAIEMGGKLTAESDGPGTGSVFTLELPALGMRNS